MNSSEPRAAERRAEAAQSIQPTSSPGRYSRVLATSEPTPRRTLRTPPKASPTTRRRGTSGKTAATSAGARRRNVEVDVEPRLRRELEAAQAHVLRRGDPAAVADLGEEARPEEDPVQEHGDEQLLDVLGCHVATAVQDRPRARGAVQRQRPAHGAPDRDDVELACGAHELDDPARDRLVDEDVRDRVAQRRDLLEVDHRRQTRERVTEQLLVDDARLVFGVGVAERRLDEEPVELGLGQRERSLVLDRVLRRHHEERIAEPPRLAVDGDLLLRHRLEQGGLRLRHRAVDLVDEDDVREDRAGAELEVAHLLVEDREAGHVGRLQVWRALDAARLRALDRAGDRPCEHGLRGTGHVLEQRVAAAHERRDDELDLLSLAVDDRFDVVEEALRDQRCGTELVSGHARPPGWSDKALAGYALDS